MEKIAINLDSSNTSIYVLGSGIVLNEPTVCAVDGDGEIKAFGADAKKIIGKTSENTRIVFPVFEGEIVNEDVAGKLLRSFLNKIELLKGFSSISAVFSVPCGTDGKSLSKYESVAKKAGISKVTFVEAPILAALGQRIPISDSSTCFLVDMASGNTNIAAISLDGIIAGISVNFGANKVATDIIDFLADVYGIQIGLLSAERIYKEIGSLAENDGLSLVVNGRDINNGKPKSIILRAVDIIDCVKKYYDTIAELTMSVLIKLPPEVSAEIRHTGVYITGVGAEIYGLSNYYKNKFDIQINVLDNPDMAVVLGGGIAIANDKIIKKICIKKA